MDSVKLVIVDLDNTLWDGTLLEDGLDGLKLNQSFADMLVQLDGRGILLAVSSKNNTEDAENALNYFGLSDLFVRKEISFAPKSEGIHKLLRFFRFAPSACLFVDDTIFEREEVKHSFPEICTASPEEFAEFKSDFLWAYASSPNEAWLRKKSYLEEVSRRSEESSHTGTFRQFLRQSGLTLRIYPASLKSKDRISELTRRTNQINFSTNRYSDDEVADLLESENHLCFIASVSDRYGDYGMVGFVCVRIEEKTAVMQDLMLSCRVQGKGLESAIIAAMADKIREKDIYKLIGLYRPTRRNGLISGAYQKMGFSPVDGGGDYQKYEIDLSEEGLKYPEHIKVVAEAGHESFASGVPFVCNIVKECISKNLLTGRLLDIGAGGDEVLGENCDNYIEVGGIRHVRLDIERFPKTDIVADALDMDVVADGEYDSVVCLEVLEHCTNPFTLSIELLRILRPGGVAVVSAPLNYVIHDTPGDYWRFTPDGLKQLFLGRVSIISEHVEGDSDFPVRSVLVFRKMLE